MAYLLDTSIAVELREGDLDIVRRVEQLDGPAFLSAISHVELEGGVYARADERERRRAAVDALLLMLPLVDFEFEMAAAYGAILAASGFSRRKIVDRMIAATAIVGSFTLITLNKADFADIEGLDILDWGS